MSPYSILSNRIFLFGLSVAQFMKLRLVKMRDYLTHYDEKPLIPDIIATNSIITSITASFLLSSPSPFQNVYKVLLYEHDTQDSQ